jgi:segregation and condensation protein B
MKLRSIVESLVFAAENPTTIRQLADLTGAQSEELKAILEALEEEQRERGIQLIAIGGGYQFRTNPDNAGFVRKLIAGRPARLTRPMLEVLSIIAYRQPITKPEVDEIRGVDCGGTLRVLLERNLLRIVGKKEEPGRPLLYGTAKYFLEFFSLRSLKDLPPLKEFAELTDEHAQQVEDRFGQPVGELNEGEHASDQGTWHASTAAAGAAASREEEAAIRQSGSLADLTEMDSALDQLETALDEADKTLRRSRAGDKAAQVDEEELPTDDEHQGATRAGTAETAPQHEAR